MLFHKKFRSQIFLIRIRQEISVAAPGGGEPGERYPQKPGKFAKDGEQFTPQPAMRIDIRKISLNLFKFLLNFLKNIQIFFKKFLKFQLNFQNLFKLVTIVFRITIINLI